MRSKTMRSKTPRSEKRGLRAHGRGARLDQEAHAATFPSEGKQTHAVL
jgi:hypothetical protein